MEYLNEDYGEINLTAISINTNRVVSANRVTKDDGPFKCKNCGMEMVVRKCSNKRDHFAHKAKLTDVGYKDHSLHDQCKCELFAELCKIPTKGKWGKEILIPAKGNVPALKPDICGRLYEKPIAIEIQKSSYTPKFIMDKTRYYSERNIYVLWIIPLKNPIQNTEFRPRLYEKFLHTMYFGHVFYWYEGLGSKLLSVKYESVTRYIEDFEFYSEDGELQTGGGYNKFLKNIKMPLMKEVDIALDFITYERMENVHPKYKELSIDSCKILNLKNKQL